MDKDRLTKLSIGFVVVVSLIFILGCTLFISIDLKDKIDIIRDRNDLINQYLE